ncbi:MAG: glycosyltransferase family A protein [Coriobacteriia bacterium]|nr:glycosyltransferase family A protein [Coriobacteriia bacterium]
MPRASVVIYMRDSVDFLAECLVSVKSQTLDGIEVLCVDHGSTDATLRLFGIIAGGDERFHLLEFDVTASRGRVLNEALAQCRGDYVSFINAADWYYDSSVLERLYRAATENDAAIVGGSLGEFDNRTNTVTDDFSDKEYLSRYTFQQEGRIEFSSWQGDIGLGRFLFSRSFLEDKSISFADSEYQGISLFIVRAMVAAGWFYAIPNIILRKRVQFETREIGKNVLDEAVDAIAEILVFCQQNEYEELKRHQTDMLMVYAVESLGLVMNEPRILQLRAKILRRLIPTKAYKQMLDIAGSYKTFSAEALKDFSLD